jgi:hypothetical protein
MPVPLLGKTNQPADNMGEGVNDAPLNRSCIFFAFWALLIGAWKNAPKMVCMRVLSPGARVGHAWLKVLWMKCSRPGHSGERTGTWTGRLRLAWVSGH